MSFQYSFLLNFSITELASLLSGKHIRYLYYENLQAMENIFSLYNIPHASIIFVHLKYKQPITNIHS